MTQELAQFDELKATITQFVAPTLAIKVNDVQSSQQAIDVAKEIKGYIALVDKKRRELVDPLNRQVKMINEYVKTIVGPLDDAENHVKEQLNNYARELEIVRQEALRKAELERKEAERKLAEERAKAEEELRAKQAFEAEQRKEAESLFGTDEDNSASEEEARMQAERERLELEAKYDREKMSSLIDYKQKEYDAGQDQIKNARRPWKCEVTDISKVPREFLIVTLNEKAVLAAARGGVKEIPGVRMWQDVQVAIGAKTYMPKAIR
jgi:hypothetical protein